jgi:hypothetical protein
MPTTLVPGLLIDSIDAHLLNQYPWSISRNGYVTARIRVYGILKTFLLHRLIMGAPSGMEVDHIYGNKLDNRRQSLRVVSPAENQANRTRMNKNNTSGYRGVFQQKGRPGWHARVRIRTISHYLGAYPSKDGAATAARAFRKLHMAGIVHE